MHLTNYAINKNNQKFEFNTSTTQTSKGHKRSLTSILSTLKQLGHNIEKVWDLIKQCIAKTVISAQPLLAHQYRSSQSNNYANNMCFQILGFDVILDSNLRPQILQVNYTPSFTTDTPLDLQIKKNLIHDSIVLMNITSKAKRYIINEKKKQMKERTLTGKNFHSRQNRLAFIQKAQLLRNLWQSKHMGNFQRILPVFVEFPKKLKKTQIDKQYSQIQQFSESQRIKNKQQIFLIQQENNFKCEQDLKLQKNKQQVQLQQKYRKFLEFSNECYQTNTGANVRRNNKILPQSNSVGQGLSIIGEQNNTNSNQINLQTFSVNSTKQTIHNQPIKYTNTEHLQKIYKSKFRPMIYKKNTGNTNKKIKQEEKETEKQLKTPPLVKQSRQEENKRIKKMSPYVSVQPGSNILHIKNKVSNSDNFINVNEEGKHQINSKNVSYLPRENILKNQANNRGGSSLKKGLSTAYNVPFNKKW